MADPIRKDPPETRRYIGAGYYLLIGECVELGCDEWPDDEGVYLQFMKPEDGHAMVAAFAREAASRRSAPLALEQTR